MDIFFRFTNQYVFSFFFCLLAWRWWEENTCKNYIPTKRPKINNYEKKIRIYNHYQDLNYLIQRAMGEASTVFASCVLLRSSIIKSKQCNHYCELSESVLLPNKSWLKRAVIRDRDASSTFSYHSIVSVAPSPKILISFYFFFGN